MRRPATRRRGHAAWLRPNSNLSNGIHQLDLVDDGFLDPSPVFWRRAGARRDQYRGAARRPRPFLRSLRRCRGDRALRRGGLAPSAVGIRRACDRGRRCRIHRAESARHSGNGRQAVSPRRAGRFHGRWRSFRPSCRPARKGSAAGTNGSAFPAARSVVRPRRLPSRRHSPSRRCRCCLRPDRRGSGSARTAAGCSSTRAATAAASGAT